MAKKVDINGFWEIKDNPLTKEGVFPYLGKQIDPEGRIWGLDPNRIYWVYRPVEEISKEDTLASFENKPFINGHTMLGDGCTPTDDANIAGVIHNIRCVDGTMVGDFTIYSDEIKRDIKKGKKQLSLGYRASFEKKTGLFDGKSYDFIQVGLVGNHVALVDSGRCGSDVRIFDKSLVCDSLEIPQMEIKREELKSMLDGMDAATLEKAKSALDSLKPDVADEGASAKDDELKADDAAKADTQTADNAPKAQPEDAPKSEVKDEALENKVKELEAKIATMDEEAIRKDAAVQARRAASLHDRLVPHIGEFCMDEMFTEQDVAVYGCKKLAEKGLIADSDVNAGSELATLTGFLAGRKESNAKVVTIDAGVKSEPKVAFDFRAAYLAK